MNRSDVERAVVEWFKVCHKDLEPAAIEAEIDARMARIKAKPAKKARKPKRDIFTGYQLKRSHRLNNGRIEPTKGE